MEIVNFVKYKVYMGNKNNNKNLENKHQMTQHEDIYQYSEIGVYLRDDHCDWGSSGMNEFTKEYSESK